METASVPESQRIAEKIVRVGRARGALAHTLLIHGPPGAGHRETATRVGQAFFCDAGTGPFGACGECRNCRRVGNGTHPDWIWLEPDREAKGLPNIAIEQLRALQDRMILEPFEGPKVVGCLFEAEKMRPEAANSLLKLLEEPPSHAQFVLVTESRQKILPTIRSRCLPIPLSPPAFEQVVEEITARMDCDPDEARWIALRSASEGKPPEEVRSEEAAALREDARELLDRAVREGEFAFLAALKERRPNREAIAELLRLWRDYLRETLLLSEGAPESVAYREETETFRGWGKKISGESLAKLIDLTVDLEEAILGYVNPTHTAATFLTAVTASAEASPR